ncbi:YjbH domain-containing protein [Porticoccaceae bacterium]|nr:YjbH domain-containing protein [Porticoccaceae bacterium]
MQRHRALILLGLFVLSVEASASDFGTTGLIDIPTARMASDGTLTSSAAIQSRTNSYSITYQATPWLEGTFRYTGFNKFFHYDRNYEAKLLLQREGSFKPQIAVGIRDLVGTGVFGSEYLVASKMIGNFDITLGMGWGRLAGKGMFKNPLTQLSESFGGRDEFSGTGGELSSGTFFRGEQAGLFGGLSYSLASLPVELMLEYHPDQYYWESDYQGSYKPESPWTAGISWEALPGVKLSLSRQHNQEWGISLSAAIDTKARPVRRSPYVMASSRDIVGSDLPSMLNKEQWYDLLLYDAERSGLILVEATIDRETQVATLVMGNKAYPIWADAIAQMTVLADLHLPSRVKSLRFVIEEEGHQVYTLPIRRPSRNAFGDTPKMRRKVKLLPAKAPEVPQHRTDFVQKKLFIDANLSTRFQLFDPDDPARYQLYGKLGISLALPDSWALRGAYTLDITNTFKESKRESDSTLPHVRSDIVKYLTEGSTGLDSLFLEKRGSLTPQLHYRAYGGILEEMYSGVGGEVLYQPYQSRLAFGLSSNWVQQRDYDKSFDLLEYQTTTAFASAYWASPFYNFDFAVHAGRYLAKDFGATIEVRRTFSNGWMIGLWATITDVPFEDFGEGSFDKGMFFKIPLNTLFNQNIRSAYSTRVRPIQRDGGARLEDFSGNIWWDLRAVRYDALMDNNDRMNP